MAEIISVDKVRKFILEKQGLRTEKPAKSTLDIIRKIHNVQIDTTSVVARSQDLILFNRLPDYKEKDVWELERDKKLFESYSHALCLIPIEEFPFYLWIFEHIRENPGNWTKKWIKGNKKIVDSVYDYIKKHGETSSSNFKGTGKSEKGGWGEIKAESMALKYLFNSGKLLIAFRKGFQRYYDLVERVLPANISTEPLERSELPSHMLNIILTGLGIASSNEMVSYLGRTFPRIVWKGKRQGVNDFLNRCVKDGIVRTINVQDFKDTYYILESDYSSLVNQDPEIPCDVPVKLLSPFDNIIRDRYFSNNIWDFNYKFEAYVAKAKRQYGFFCLPILDNYDLVGFIDVKAHRKENTLELISGYINKEVDANFAYRFVKGVQSFAHFHNCSEISIGNFYPNKIKKTLVSEIKKI
ncbi:MAG: winged helix-turn-helix domain-containing protein [Promethearchaeota archaeon]|jgi:uncharacterized protein YcaQ